MTNVFHLNVQIFDYFFLVAHAHTQTHTYTPLPMNKFRGRTHHECSMQYCEYRYMVKYHISTKWCFGHFNFHSLK